MMVEGKGALSIHKGRDDFCGYCGDRITEDEMQVTYVVHPTHWHLHSSGQCEGWMFRNWEFIKALLHTLTDIAGDDYTDVMDMLIRMWEEGP